MASKATVIRSEPGLIVVEVAHRASDSYSRSVNVAANKAWRAARREAGERWTWHAAHRYGWNTSLVVYAESSEAAAAVLDSYPLPDGAVIA